MKKLITILTAVGLSLSAMAQVGFQTQGFQTYTVPKVANIGPQTLYILGGKPIELQSGKTSVTVAIGISGKIANTASANTATLTCVGQTSLDGNNWVNRLSVNGALSTNQATGQFVTLSTNLDFSTNRWFRWYSVSNSLTSADNVANTNGQGVVTQFSVTNTAVTLGYWY